MTPSNPPSQSSRSSHLSRLSPRSPQMWTKPVYKGVDNRVLSVRFAASVRLSPSVDLLWTGSALGAGATHCRCAYRAARCARPTTNRCSSTPLHSLGAPTSTPTPHLECRLPRGHRVIVHTFPNTYDDDYIYSSPHSHTRSELPAVDDSRTLALTFVGHPSRRSISHEGGHT